MFCLKLGNFTYQYLPDVAPVPADLRNGHGLARDHEDNIYFVYEPINL